MTTFLVLVNTRSGGQEGPHLLHRFAEVVGSSEVNGEVVNITEATEEGVLGPKPSLLKYSSTQNLRVIVCGGDGTVGWVLAVMEQMEWKHGAPPIAIIPMGTGNDLSRSFYWGGRYKDKPVKKVLYDVTEAEVGELDRWRIHFQQNLSGEKHSRAIDSIPSQNSVFNNYFSLGIDAHIALQFHNARNANQDKFTSRTRNLLFYGLEGGKDLLVQKWRHLMEDVEVRCKLKDGSVVDITKTLKDYGAHSILFLNIRNYSGGTKPWKQKTGYVASQNDGLIEIIALDNIDLALLHIGGTGVFVCQAREVELTTTRAVPMQVDGEPMLVNPCTLRVAHHNTVRLLNRKKTNYPYRDPEIDEWAARKIQSSFKQYKREKGALSSPQGVRQQIYDET